MAGHALNYDPVPSVNPTGAPPNDYERIDVNPDAFGFGKAQATQTLGQGIEKSATEGFSVLDQQAQIDGKTHAAELHSWQSDQTTDAQEKFLTLKGKAALDGLPAFKQNIQELHDQALGQAGNPYTKLLVEQEGRRLVDITYAGAARHAATERNTWETTTAKNSAISYGDGAVLSAVQSQAPKIGDDLIVNDRLFKSDQEIRNHWSMQGYDGPALDQEVAKNRGRNVGEIVKQITADGSKTGLQRAIAFFHGQYDKIDPATRVSIEQGLKAQSALYDGQTRSDSIMGRAQNVPPGYIARTFQLESGSAAATGTPAADSGSHRGLGQWSPAMEARYGINESNRSDPNANARAFALENRDNHDALVKVLGHEPAPADYYFAHQQGIGGAVSHLSQPNLPAWQNMASTAEGREKGEGWAKQAIWGNMTPEMKAQFPGGVETVSSGDFARMWAQKFNGTAIAATNPLAPGDTRFAGAQSFTSQNKADVLSQIQNDPYLMDHPQAMQAAIAHVNKIYETESASYADQERKLHIQEQQRKMLSDNTEDTYLRDLYSPQPKTPLATIVNDTRLSHEARKRLIDIAKGPDKDDKTYGAGFEHAFQMVHASQGTPGRITDPTQLYERLAPSGDPATRLTMAGVEKLRQEIDLRKSPAGVAEAEMRKQFLANAKAQITGANEGLHIKDPKGDELYLKFLAQALPAYDKARREGKTPEQLLAPDSPDYVGKSVEAIKRKPDQWYKDLVEANPALGADGGPTQTTPAKTFDITSIKTLDDAVAAYRDGNITKAQADEIGMSRFGATRKPKPQAVVQQPAAAFVPAVPMSR